MNHININWNASAFICHFVYLSHCGNLSPLRQNSQTHSVFCGFILPLGIRINFYVKKKSLPAEFRINPLFWFIIVHPLWQKTEKWSIQLFKEKKCPFGHFTYIFSMIRSRINNELTHGSIWEVSGVIMGYQGVPCTQ